MSNPESLPPTLRLRTDALLLAWLTSPMERELLDEWLREHRGRHPEVDVVVLALTAGRPSPDVVGRLSAILSSRGDRVIVPVRVLWTPASGTSTASRIAGFLTGRDPYRPTERQQRRILRRDRSRARVVSGEPATTDELRAGWFTTTDGGAESEFAEFVVRRAVLAIERAEYRLLGPEYKSPRLVKPELLARSRFRDGLADIPGATLEEAASLLDEMATGWSRLSVDLLPALGRFIFRRGFHPTIDYDPTQVEAMRQRLQQHPAVMLFSHRSNLDSLVLAVALQENRLSRAHLFGGINMSFGLMGPIMRRSGVIFIRRDIGNNPLYKYVLKQYVAYLAEKRFTLTWSIEGSRSRTGKMLPPKLGLLSYAAAPVLDGRIDDLLLQPVSISFDQLHETGEYAAYARGAEKKPEGIGWFYRFVKAQGARHYGKIYVRFPAPVSAARYLKPAASGDPATLRLALQKTAFEVAWRILQGTPINATGLVSALLLSARGRALTTDELHIQMQDWLDHLISRGVPMTSSALQLRTTDGVRAAVGALSGGHPVTKVDVGREPVWRIAPEHEHEAAFYRNTIAHTFLEKAIVELGLAYAMRADDPLDAFWSQVMRLRDLLKFDYYFGDTNEFRANVAAEMAWCPDWETRVRGGVADIETLLGGRRPLVAATILGPVFEAYLLIADVLYMSPPDADAKDLIRRALGVGGQYVAQGRVRSNESVSTLLFATAHQVAADQNLLAHSEGMYTRRAAFVDELKGVIADLDKVEQVAGTTPVGRHD